MTRIRLLGASFAHADHRPILEPTSLELGLGISALVGPNGSGKSTLLQLLSGQRSPTLGAVRIEPGTLVVHHLGQGVDAPSGAVRVLAEDSGRFAGRLRDELGLDPQGLDRWASLSVGERRRWLIGALMHVEPDVLLLDEPEAHLDAEGRARLRTALARFQGLAVLVSHDRDLIDAIAARTLWLEQGHLEVYPGGYTQAAEQRRHDRERTLERRRIAQRRASRLEREQVARRERVAAADRSIRASARIKGPRDHDGRSALARGRAEQAAATLARRTGALRGRVEAAREAVATEAVGRSLGRAVSFAAMEAAGRWALRAELPRVAFGGRVILEPTTIAVARGERVHIAGANGAGKSTLLLELVRRAARPEGLLYLPQTPSPAEREGWAERVRGLPPQTRGALLSLVAAWGLDPEVASSSPKLSPGETKKLALAHALASELRGLVLDEPEAHLDAPAVERLEEALLRFEGAVVLVTHESRLAGTVATRRLRLSAGHLRPG